MPMPYRLRWRAAMVGMAAVAAVVPARGPMAADPVVFDEISVTATRDERATKDVPQAITVVGKDRIDAEKMTNVKDALTGTPGVLIDTKNGGYDVRLVIRGAGQSAAYGVREIMVLRDGVPFTDPDSFTLFDRIDPQDIQRVEVVKGPGSPFAAGSAGGTINIVSKSVFDQANIARVGLGNFGAQNYHLRVGGDIADGQAAAISASRRVLENDWRDRNQFETNIVTLKHGLSGAGGGILESEMSISNALMQIPGTMNRSQFDQFRSSGRQPGTGDVWKWSGRDSQTIYGNVRYERDYGDFTFRPRVYGSWWGHYHPVTGQINESNKNYTFGADIEGVQKHRLGDMPSSLSAGVTGRVDLSIDARKYRYADIRTSGGTIVAVNSDRKGELMSTENTSNYLLGTFMQETVQVSNRLSADLGARIDRSMFTVDTNEVSAFNWSTSAPRYVGGSGISSASPSYTLFSPRMGLSYKLTPELTGWSGVSQADQVPSSSQISSNPTLKAAETTNYEVGLKQRSKDWQADLSAYWMPIRNDITQVWQDSKSVYENAGKTLKRGVELAVGHNLVGNWWLGGSYAYSDYKYRRFTETVRSGATGYTASRNGNQVPFVPVHQYSVFLDYKSDFGLRGRIAADSWGAYYMDAANTEKYGGYSFVTKLFIGYDLGPHSIGVNVENLFDQYYAAEVKKDTSGNRTFAAASPRAVVATYSLKF